MGEIDFSGVVSGASGYVPPHNPYEGSFSNPVSGWNLPPTIQRWPDKTRFQFISDNARSHIRYDDDREGRHVHYDNLVKNGFILKISINGKHAYDEFHRKAAELKRLGNGFVRNVRELFQSDDEPSAESHEGFSVSVNVRIMRLCPYCNSEISAEFQECPHCRKKLV